MRSSWLLVTSLCCVPGAGLALAAGCSSSSNNQPLASQSDAGDATAASEASDDGSDAGPNIDQDPDAYPADHEPIPQIDYNGGPVLQHTRIVTVTFSKCTATDGGTVCNPDPHRDSMRSFDHTITTSSWWQQTAEGYCVPGGDACVGDGTAKAPEGGAWMPDGSTADGGDGYLDVEMAYDFAGSTIDDTDIQAWLARHITAGDFPAPDAQTLYVLYFPTTTSITLQGSVSCEQFGAYHNSAALTGGSVANAAYATIPFCDYGQGDQFNFQQVTISASHEIAEAATDPQPDTATAFYLHSNDAWLGALSYGGGECGDMCTYVNNSSVLDPSGWFVQRIWSNQAAAQSKQPCQPWDDVNQPYFAAALRAPPMKVNGHTSAGYVVVKRGTSTTAIADVFSEAPLAADLLLMAGKTKTSQSSPSDLAAPDDFITIDLSKNQAHNGNGVYVTFTAPSKSVPGDFRVVLRAILEGSQYNDWPVIVHVE